MTARIYIIRTLIHNIIHITRSLCLFRFEVRTRAYNLHGRRLWLGLLAVRRWYDCVMCCRRNGWQDLHLFAHFYGGVCLRGWSVRGQQIGIQSTSQTLQGCLVEAEDALRSHFCLLKKGPGCFTIRIAPNMLLVDPTTSRRDRSRVLVAAYIPASTVSVPIFSFHLTTKLRTILPVVPSIHPLKVQVRLGFPVILVATMNIIHIREVREASLISLR